MKNLVLLFCVVFCGIVVAQDGLPTNFDYSKNGADWEDEYCVNVKSRTVLNLSPIDFDPSKAKKFTNSYYFFPKYVFTEAKLKKYNITVELNATEEYGKAYTITAGSQFGIYQATSIRIHSESEHRFQGKSYPVELQIYHKIIQSDQPPEKYQANLFISVFFDDSEDSTSNDLLANITTAITNESPTVPIDLSYILDLAATRKKVYSYGGTQTMPPCNPTSWFVFPEPFHASSEQIKIIRDLYRNGPDFTGEGNYRIPPKQPETGTSGYFLINGDDAKSANIEL